MRWPATKLNWVFAIAFATVSNFTHDGLAKETKVPPKRPNILFAFADDWGRFASVYSHLDGPGTPNDVIRTPNIDRLASEGVVFRRAFVSAPSCTPCRSALVSGQHFWRTGRGAILRGAVWDGSQPSFPLLLKNSGYHIGETYKVWSPGTPNDGPFGSGKHAYERAGGRFNQFSENVTKLVNQGCRSTMLARSCTQRCWLISNSFYRTVREMLPSVTGLGQPMCIANG